MNEQLVVKNFGPIKDATVDFKRVTVFIGPTGGGKSTLAKLKDIFLYRKNYSLGEKHEPEHPRFDNLTAYFEHSLTNYFSKETLLDYNSRTVSVNYDSGRHFIGTDPNIIPPVLSVDELRLVLDEVKEYTDAQQEGVIDEKTRAVTNKLQEIIARLNRTRTKERVREDLPSIVAPIKPWYCPSERVFVSSLEYSWTGLLRDDIGLPKNILGFANNFSISRKSISELDIPFFNVQYIHRNGQDFIQVPGVETLFRLYETASGIQSVTPLLVLLEHLSRNTEQAQSFIIEEPELNLYPTAQQGLLNWLVEKCTKGENDLTITTHSPYILSSCNLLLEAYKVAQQRPELEAEIAAIVPKECWLNPDEFAAYYVADGTVKPITDVRTHLIGTNELDAVSGDISDSFRKLLWLKKQAA